MLFTKCIDWLVIILLVLTTSIYMQFYIYVQESDVLQQKHYEVDMLVVYALVVYSSVIGVRMTNS